MKSIETLCLMNYMHKATYHIKLYFYEVLGDIKID